MKKKVVSLLLFFLFQSLIGLEKNLNHKNIQATIFITGAAGFIGSNFLSYMFEKYSNYRFIVLDALTYAANIENIPLHIRNSNRFCFFYGSITNPYIVDKLMSISDFVVHFAAESDVTRSIHDDAIFFETDVLGTRTMMASLVKYKNKIKRFIHISTSEVLGTAESDPMDESHPINPRSPYAAAKAGADRLVYSYCCTYDVPAVIVRPFNNYGPRQHLEKVIPNFIMNAINGSPLTIHGDGLQERDWVHTFDIANALDLILHIDDFSKIKHQVFHLGSGVPVSILDIAKMVLKHFDKMDNEIIFVDDRPGQVKRHIASGEKAKNLLGWTPKIKFEDGLIETIRWYENNQTQWEKQEFMINMPMNFKTKFV